MIILNSVAENIKTWNIFQLIFLMFSNYFTIKILCTKILQCSYNYYSFVVFICQSDIINSDSFWSPSFTVNFHQIYIDILIKLQSFSILKANECVPIYRYLLECWPDLNSSYLQRKCMIVFQLQVHHLNIFSPAWRVYIVKCKGTVEYNPFYFIWMQPHSNLFPKIAM